MDEGQRNDRLKYDTLIAAGWRRSKDLEIPKGVSLLRLPPYSPELNSMENVFGHLKSSKLANRLFDAWTEFAGQPDRIASIRTGEWVDITK
ncbi:MAG: transposase [Albidovulum sp.]|nr:transposase [Albidovulum sp.]